MKLSVLLLGCSEVPSFDLCLSVMTNSLAFLFGKEGVSASLMGVFPADNADDEIRVEVSELLLNVKLEALRFSVKGAGTDTASVTLLRDLYVCPRAEFEYCFCCP